MQENIRLGKKVSDVVSQISTATREQAQGIQQMNTTVSQIEKVTQNNAATAEESASAGEELSSQAAIVKETVAELLQLVGSHELRTAPPRNPVAPAQVPAARKTPGESSVRHAGPVTRHSGQLPMPPSRQNAPGVTDGFKDF